MFHMFIKKCRSCNSKNLKNLFSLGELSFTGKFSKENNINIPKAELGLKICTHCKLVQLSKNFDLKYKHFYFLKKLHFVVNFFLHKI